MNLLYHIAASLELPSSMSSSSPSSPTSSSSSTSPRDYDPTFNFTDDDHPHRILSHLAAKPSSSSSSSFSFSSSSSSLSVSSSSTSYSLPSMPSFSSPHIAPASMSSPSSSSRRASFSDTLSVSKQKLKSQHNRKRPSLPQDVFCRSCLTTKSPEWRRGPDGLKSLCNACGLRFAQMVKKEQLIAPANPSVSRVRIDNLLN